VGSGFLADRRIDGETVVVDGRASEPHEEEFQRIYNEHVKLVGAYALRRCPNAADAADVLSETFMTAWQRIDDVPSGEATLPWLYRVAFHKISNYSRGNRRRDNLFERLRSHFVATDEAQTSFTSPEVDTALATLSAEDKELILLSGVEGLKPSEIGLVLDLPSGTVRTRLHRVRSKLRTQLEKPLTE